MSRLALFFRRFFVGVTVDEIAEAIHLADDRATSAWPDPRDPDKRFAPFWVRVASDAEIDIRRRQARVAARMLGVRLVEG